MSRKKSILVLSVTLAIMMSFFAVANAYQIYVTWPYTPGTTLTVTYKWASSMPSDSDWRTAFSTSVSDWNALGTKAKYSYNSSSQNQIGLVNIAGGSPGYCYWQIDPNTWKLISFTAVGNTAVTGGWSPNAKRSTSGHELGHGFGLNHEGFVIPKPIMDPARDRTVVYTPQQDDYFGVVAMYH